MICCKNINERLDVHLLRTKKYFFRATNVVMQIYHRWLVVFLYKFYKSKEFAHVTFGYCFLTAFTTSFYNLFRCRVSDFDKLFF